MKQALGSWRTSMKDHSGNIDNSYKPLSPSVWEKKENVNISDGRDSNVELLCFNFVVVAELA